MWDVLDEVITGNPVLLNRAPTLHRLGIQAFEPVLIDGKAIQIHPLVCAAFNADFDGDQMAVDLPLSLAAQAEARILMLSANNILLPADGKPVVGPTHDMILGLHYLTILPKAREELFVKYIRGIHSGKPFRIENLRLYSSEEELKLAYDLGEVGLQDLVWVRIKRRSAVYPEDKKIYSIPNGVLLTTLGRVIVNQVFPADLPFYNMTLRKEDINDIIAALHKKYGVSDTVDVLDEMKRIGFQYATVAGITIAIDDVTVPAKKWELIEEADKEVKGYQENFEKEVSRVERKVTDEEEKKRKIRELEDERYISTIKRWTEVTTAVTDMMMDNFDKMNPVYMMAHSGARGKVSQIKQLAALRGLMADPTGKIIELPIKSNFREGLSVLEYFISTHGARKGLADTALRTADSGYLTRRLVDVAQDVMISEVDCGTDDYIEMTAAMDGKKIVQTLAERLLGRVAAENILDEETGEIVITKGETFDELISEKIDHLGLETVKVRSVLSCASRSGVCRACYGRDLATGRPVELGARSELSRRNRSASPAPSLRCAHSIPAVSPEWASTISLRVCRRLSFCSSFSRLDISAKARLSRRSPAQCIYTTSRSS